MQADQLVNNHCNFIMNQTSPGKIIWFSRLLRWSLGVLFIAIGVLYFNERGWPAILFGVIFLVTGFFRPKRCIDGSCTLPKNQNSSKK